MLRKWSVRLVVLQSTLLVAAVGCDTTAEDLGKKVDQQAQQAGQSLSADAEKMLEKGSELAKSIGAEAMSFLGPLKEKLGGLEGLKDKPEELKTSVTEMLQSLESNIANLPLPDGLKATITQLKEKLQVLQDYLGGAVDPAKLQEYLDGIKEFVKNQLG
jgi:hypothetical protein